MYSTANAFHRQEQAGGIQLLKEAAMERGVTSILTPEDELILESARKLMQLQQESHQPRENIGIKYIQPHLQTKVSILIVDKKYSLAIELKNDTKQTSIEAIGLAVLYLTLIANLQFCPTLQYLKAFGYKLNCIKN